jgi:hypothetical protein
MLFEFNEDFCYFDLLLEVECFDAFLLVLVGIFF